MKTNTLFKLIPGFIFLFFSFQISAQSIAKEIGIRLGNYSNYEVTYKNEISANKLRRLRLSAARLSFDRKNDFTHYDVQAAIAFGVEKREQLISDFYFYHGWEPGISVGVAGDSVLRQLNINPRLGYVLGFMYMANSKLVIGIEAVPSLYLNTTYNPRDNQPDNSNVSVGLNFNNLINLSLAYRFQK